MQQNQIFHELICDWKLFIIFEENDLGEFDVV